MYHHHSHHSPKSDSHYSQPPFTYASISCATYGSSPAQPWITGTGLPQLTPRYQEIFPDDPFYELSLPALHFLGEEILHCNWPQCSTEGPFNAAEYRLHTKCHTRDAHATWSPGMRCTWYGCSSKAQHKTWKQFDVHLNNIHVNPLICTVSGCGYKKPFRANSELQRHIETTHTEKKFECPFQNCEQELKSFPRKDKWMKHIRDRHDFDPCPFAHCLNWAGFVAPENCESAARHISKAHGDFECSIKSCKGSLSQFTESALLEHLQLAHGIDWKAVLVARDTVKAGQDHTLIDDHVSSTFNVCDCTSCWRELDSKTCS